MEKQLHKIRKGKRQNVLLLLLILMVSGLNAKVIFSPVTPCSEKKIGGVNAENIIEIDLDGDNFVDVSINYTPYQFGDDLSWVLDINGIEFATDPTQMGFDNLVVDLKDEGEAIGMGLNFYENGDADEIDYKDGGNGLRTLGVGIKYIPFKWFTWSDENNQFEVYFGWIAISLSNDLDFKVLGYAYNNDSYAPINAGEGAEFIESISISSTSGNYFIDVQGGELQFNVDAITPASATIQDIEWTVESVEGEASIDQNGLLKASKDGQVKVQARAKDGSCVYGEQTVEISNQIITSTEDLKTLEATLLFPNPTRGTLNIKTNHIYTALQIIDMQGKTVLYNTDPNQSKQLDLNNLKPGCYLLQINYLNGEVSKHQIIKTN